MQGSFSALKVEPRFRWAGYLALIAAVIARAPTIIEDGKVFGLEIGLNAGYVVIFGPLVLLGFYLDTLRAVIGSERIEDRATGQVFAAIVTFPALAAAFLAFQYFLLVRPDVECDGLFHPAQFGTGNGYKPVYCIGLGDDWQDELPHVLDPPIVLALVQIIAPVVCASCAIFIVKRVRLAVKDLSSDGARSDDA